MPRLVPGLLIALILNGLSLSGATFGTVVPLVGGAADLVLDEPRGRLYLVNTSRNQIEVYSIPQRRFLNAIRTDATPLGAAMSRDGRLLYVAAYDASAINIINLESLAVTTRVTLPAKPEGIAVGFDERVVLTTIGTGANNSQNIVLIYNPADNSINNVTITPPAPTPPQLPPPSGRPALAVRSSLVTSRDGRIIVGSNIPNGTQRSIFVYEVASATILRARRVNNISNVLSIAPDGSRFMAGLTLFETESLIVLAQQNLANAPFPIAPNTNFNTQANQGGSVFTPDGASVYSAFNIAPTANPPTRPNVSQLMISDADNLLVTQGIQLPENLSGKMIISGDGANIYALSESGFLILPMSTLNQQPLASVDRDIVLLNNDQCGVMAGERAATIAVRNVGRGRVTASASLLQFPATGPGGLGGAGGAGGGAPGGGVIIVIPVIPGIPGGGGATPNIPGGGGQQNVGLTQTQPTLRAQNTADGTNLTYTFSPVAARSLGTTSPVHDYLIQSNEAVNLPPRVRILQNNRNAEARGDIVPIPVGISANEALEDLTYDATRQRLYIANSGRNRVEVFDIRTRRLMPSIRVGQLPRSLALSPDGRTLFVANSGSEYLSVVDPDTMREIDKIRFPAIPFDASVAISTPSIIAASQRGPMFLTNTGTIWRVVGRNAVPRGVSTIIGANAAGQPNTIAAPRSMAATPNGENVILFGGNGFVYLYDALVDDFVQSRQIQAANAGGFVGPITAGPRGQYYVVNGILLNQSLTPVAQAPTLPQPPNATAGNTVATNIPVSAVFAVGGGTYARFTQPVRTNANAVVTQSGNIELVDTNTGFTLRQAPTLESPLTTVLGNARAVVGGRTLAVDAAGTTAFALTTSGLSIIPLDVPTLTDRPLVNTRGAVNYGSFQPTYAQNGLISIFGRNLASTGTADWSRPLPTLLGGVCVTLNNTPLPLLMTSGTQINAQIPPEQALGNAQLIVRAVDRKVAAVQQTIGVARYAPAVLVDSQTGQVSLFRRGGQPVTKQNPAKRDEPLTMYAVGLGLPRGGRITGGTPTPSDPVLNTERVQVFFGDPRIREAEVIVDSSTLVPMTIGLYQLQLRVPGAHLSGDALPVTLRIGNVNSPTTGPLVPRVAVD
jgi:uncharacterized protein (TIGR03437 family)